MQRISDSFGNAITGRIQRRMMKAYPNLETSKLLAEQAETKKDTKREGEKETFAKGCEGFYKLLALFFIGALPGRCGGDDLLQDHIRCLDEQEQCSLRRIQHRVGPGLRDSPPPCCTNTKIKVTGIYSSAAQCWGEPTNTYAAYLRSWPSNRILGLQ